MHHPTISGAAPRSRLTESRAHTHRQYTTESNVPRIRQATRGSRLLSQSRANLEAARRRHPLRPPSGRRHVLVVGSMQRLVDGPRLELRDDLLEIANLQHAYSRLRCSPNVGKLRPTPPPNTERSQSSAPSSWSNVASTSFDRFLDMQSGQRDFSGHELRPARLAQAC